MSAADETAESQVSSSCRGFRCESYVLRSNSNITRRPQGCRQYGVERRGTLGLLIEAIHADLLTVKLVSALADDLLATEYRLPFRPGRFEAWALENGLL